ncbi:DUF6069 family protein [Stackebrandtia soli]|uniref:DUF6069 family protein n=1 Tax=Stackebrandtia soli TaxID=1892856 RepID=UPI0039EBEC82
MTEPHYEPGRAQPTPPMDPTDPTTQIPYGAPPPPHRDRRPRVAAGRLWAGGFGTAVVVALVIVVGILLVRGVLGIPVLAAEGEGIYGTATTTQYALAGAAVALAATALLHLLLLIMPRPMQFFYWICVLVTAVAVLLPFTFGAALDAQIATAGINLVAGLCLTSILGSIGSTSARAAS